MVTVEGFSTVTTASLDPTATTIVMVGIEVEFVQNITASAFETSPPIAVGQSAFVETAPGLETRAFELSSSAQFELPATVLDIFAPTIPSPGPYESLAALVRDRIGDLIESETSMAVEWPNDFEDPPQEASWAEIQINHIETVFVAWGGDRLTQGHRYRLNGEARIILRDPLGAGTDNIMSIVDTVRAAFPPGKENGVDYGPTFVGREGQDWWAGHEQKWRVDIVMPFSQALDIISYPDIVPSALASAMVQVEGSPRLTTRAHEFVVSSVPSMELPIAELRSFEPSVPESPLATAVGTLASAQFSTYDEAHDTTRERFGRLVQDVFGTTTIYDNDPTLPADDETWVRLAVQTDQASVVGIGPLADGITRGRMTAMIFSPLGAGSQESLQLADNIALRFISVQENGVHFEVPSVRTIGRGAQWWQTNVGCPFFIREVS